MSSKPATAFATILYSIVCGAVAALIGTILHAQILYVGDFPITWGTVVSLVAAGMLFTYVGLKSGRIWGAALTGIVTYVLVAWSAMDPNNRFIVPTEYINNFPGPAVAGVIWMYGVAVATFVALFVTARKLKKESAVAAGANA